MHWRDQLQWQLQQFRMDDTGHELGSNGRYPKSGQMDVRCNKNEGQLNLKYFNGR